VVPPALLRPLLPPTFLMVHQLIVLFLGLLVILNASGGHFSLLHVVHLVILISVKSGEVRSVARDLFSLGKVYFLRLESVIGDGGDSGVCIELDGDQLA
jgi:hypothetical protein